MNSEKSGSIAMSPEGNQSMSAGNMHSIFGEVPVAQLVVKPGF